MEIITLEQSEQLQQDIMAHLDGFPEELIDILCQAVVDFRKGIDPKADLLAALKTVQIELAKWRDDDPTGQNLEELKYCVVDEAIEKAEYEES